MIIYPCEELGCFFRLNGDILEQAPMFVDGTCDHSNFGERDIGDYAKFMFRGKMRTIKTIERMVIKSIKEMEASNKVEKL